MCLSSAPRSCECRVYGVPSCGRAAAGLATAIAKVAPVSINKRVVLNFMISSPPFECFGGHDAAPDRVSSMREKYFASFASKHDRIGLHVGSEVQQRGEVVSQPVDRKSTRLNSSH